MLSNQTPLSDFSYSCIFYSVDQDSVGPGLVSECVCVCVCICVCVCVHVCVCVCVDHQLTILGVSVRVSFSLTVTLPQFDGFVVF